MKIHKVADLLPRMTDAEFAALRKDVETHGVRVPVWVWDGQIIDGRHRWQACEELGIECPTQEYEGDTSLKALGEFVWSLNGNRRHLNESQRAMVAADLANLGQGERKSNASIEAFDQSEAADLVNVSRSAVQRATKVKNQGAPELVEAVKSGEVSVSAAAAIVDLPEEQQVEAVKGGKKAVAQAAKAAKSPTKPTGADKKPKAEPKPAVSEVEALRARVKELEERNEILAAQATEVQAENESMGKICDADDKLAAAAVEIKRLTSLVVSLEARIRGLMTSSNEAVRDARSWQRKAERLMKAAA